MINQKQFVENLKSGLLYLKHKHMKLLLKIFPSLLLLGCILLAENSLAQTKQRKWSLEDCLNYAVTHNIDIKQLDNQRTLDEINQNTAKNSRLPNIDAAALQNWNFGRAQWFLDINEPLSRSGAGISSSLPLFTGFRIPNEIAKAKLEYAASTQNLEKAKNNLSIRITSLFLQVLFHKELIKINQEQLAYTESQIKKTEILIEAGSVPSINLFDIRAQLAKEKVSLVEAKNELKLSLVDLAQTLELEQSNDFDIIEPALGNDKLLDMLVLNQSAQQIYEHAVKIKPIIKEQEYRVQSAKKSQKIAQSAYMPKLDVVLETGTGYLYRYDAEDQVNPRTNEIIYANPSFSNQLKDNHYTLIGFNLSIPLFNKLQNRNKVKTAEIDLLNRELELAKAKKTLYKEIQIASTNLTASFEKYLAAEGAVYYTSEALKNADVRYELSKMTSFEYDKIKTQYVQAQYKQTQAKYEYILRKKILDFYKGIPISL